MPYEKEMQQDSELLKNKKVAIIGAGPVGLTMARLLQQEGIEVRVYERDENAGTRITGGTLDLHPGSGQDALKKAGLLQQYYDQSTPMGRTVADEQGIVLFSRKPTREDQYNDPEINRNDLRKLLLDSLTADTVVWNRRFLSLEEQNGQWLLQFENNITTTADLVIGANGGMSKVRKYVSDVEIEYTGTLILQGEVVDPEITCPAFYHLCNDHILMSAYGGDLLVANPRNGDILSYSIMFRKPDGWEQENKPNLEDSKHFREFLLNRFADWNESYKQLISSTTSFIEWHTRKISLDKPWRINRPMPITLIGDAAHIMPPFAGQGVNTGLLDALILSGNLTSGRFESVEAAISEYERQMFVYASEAQKETDRNESAMFLAGFSFLTFYQ